MSADAGSAGRRSDLAARRPAGLRLGVIKRACVAATEANPSRAMRRGQGLRGREPA